jgi:hypothetical protein
VTQTKPKQRAHLVAVAGLIIVGFGGSEQQFVIRNAFLGVLLCLGVFLLERNQVVVDDDE